MALILASASPRRSELLRLITADFLVVTSQADESLPAGIPPPQAVMLLARRKAEAVALSHPGDVIVGADTLVVLGDEIFGKPRDRQHAVDMLTALSGRTHAVHTGVCVCKADETDCFFKTAYVTFAAMDKQEIADYAASGEPDDKAGAYGIQGRGARFIAHIEGDYYTVMGLPVQALYRALRRWGIATPL